MPLRRERALELERAYMAQLAAAREPGFGPHNISHERQIFLTVEEGNPEATAEVMERYYPAGTGSEIRMDLAEQRNICIYIITLSAWAAVWGGVPQEEAFALLHAQLQRLEGLCAVEDVVTLKRRVAIDFAQFTHSHARREESMVVRRAKEYVGLNLHGPLRAEEVAKALHLHRNSLAALFKRETGNTLSYYIRQEKLKEAKYRLACTAEEITSISITLGYSSQSHFGDVFRRETGMTPKTYREIYTDLCVFDKTGKI